MKNSELKAILDKFPDDIEVKLQGYSHLDPKVDLESKDLTCVNGSIVIKLSDKR
jgi:hypothetical protein